METGLADEDGLAEVVSLMLDFLASKSLVASERALRNELQLLIHSTENSRDQSANWKKTVRAHNVYTSDLERRLQITIPINKGAPDSPIVDNTPVQAACSPVRADEDEPRLPEKITGGRVAKVAMFSHTRVSAEKEMRLRSRRGSGVPQQRVVFHDPKERDEAAVNTLAHVSLPLLYNPLVNGLEVSCEVALPVGSDIAGRYRVTANIGRGSFSKVYQCHDRHTERMVSVKVLRNDKDCFDAGLGEVRVLSLITQRDPLGQRQVLRLLDYFYYKEHLVIVTELLRDSLFSFCAYLQSRGQRLEYFTPPVLAALSSQLLEALKFLHDLGITHCDVKPENVCLSSASRHIFKLIDFGSAVFTFDCHNSYVQSRWYRAPEVMLGMVWDSRVDIWSVGCVLAEVIHGAPIFYAPSVETVLACQVAALGPFPPHMTRTSPELAQMFVSSSGSIYQIDPESQLPGAYLLEPLEHARLDTLLKRSTDDPTGVIPFVIDLLQMDPATRPTGQEALDHPWLKAQLLASPSTDGVANVHSFTSSVLADFDSAPPSRSSSVDASPIIGSRRNSVGIAAGFQTRRTSGEAMGSHGSSSPTYDGEAPPSSRDASPMSGVFSKLQMTTQAASEWARPRGSPKRSGKVSARGKGPAIPPEFQASIEAESAAAHGAHDWRSRFVRFQAPAGMARGLVMPNPVNRRPSSPASPTGRALMSTSPKSPASFASPSSPASTTGDSRPSGSGGHAGSASQAEHSRSRRHSADSLQSGASLVDDGSDAAGLMMPNPLNRPKKRGGA